MMSVMLFGVFDILLGVVNIFSCMPHHFTSETMVRADLRWFPLSHMKR